MTTTARAAGFEAATYRKIALKLLPILFAGYFLAILDRVNVGFAKLQMASDLALSDAVYGFGAGVFFIGYFLFELPSNIILQKVGARRWIARIMVTWGLLSVGFMFTGSIGWGSVSAFFGASDAEFTFYLLRFILGIAEAGFFPGVILYLTFWFPSARRAHVVALFLIAIPLASAIGSPVSGLILQFMDGMQGMRGWQWLFLVEGIPAVLLGLVVLKILPNGPRDAVWLGPRERELVEQQLAEDEARKQQVGGRHDFAAIFLDWRIWALALADFSRGIINNAHSGAGDRHRPGQLPQGRHGHRDTVDAGSHRHGDCGTPFGQDGRAALACHLGAACVHDWIAHARLRQWLGGCLDPRADAGGDGRDGVASGVLDHSYRLPFGHCCGRRDRMDQRLVAVGRVRRAGHARAHQGSQRW
jgi:MFS family permease